MKNNQNLNNIIKKYDIVAVGNAIVDILSFVDDGFIQKNNFAKSGMVLIDEIKAEEIYTNMPPATEVSGGSAANTIAGLASLGSKTAFIGRVHEDILGDIFIHDLKSLNVETYVTKVKTGAKTARCFVAVTPDAERSMATYLGASTEISVAEISEDVIAQSKVIYIEGYLWDKELAKAAIEKIFIMAKKHQVKIAFTLSDLFCVERNREDFIRLLDNIDILFCNEAEIKALYPNEDMDVIIKKIKNKCEVINITFGSKGSKIIGKEKDYDIPASKIGTLVDTTGAGDLYASGFLYGYVNNFALPICGKIANLAAGEVITHIGARPLCSLASLIKKEGIIGENTK